MLYQSCPFFTGVDQNVGERIVKICKRFEFGAVQKYLNRVGLKTFRKSSFFKSTSIQPRTSPSKFGTRVFFVTLAMRGFLIQSPEVLSTPLMKRVLTTSIR